MNKWLVRPASNTFDLEDRYGDMMSLFNPIIDECPFLPKLLISHSQLHREINQIEQAVTGGLQITRLKLDSYPDNSFLIQIYASLSSYQVFIEISRRRIDYSEVIVASEAIAEIQIQEAGEMLSEILGRVLEAKIVVNRIKTCLENWS